MKSDFSLAFNEIVEQRSLPREVVMEALTKALVSAYRRDCIISAKQEIEARIDPDGQARILLEKEVVESVQTDQTEVTLDEARQTHPDAQLGDTVMIEVKTTRNFGRIAAQTAKQVILQSIREAEREAMYDEFVEREGDLVTGTVQSVTRGAITISLGRAEAVMPYAHQIPRERFRPHDKVRVYVVEVKKNSRGPQIIVSRAHKNMLRRLLEYEVPEIYNGQVEIKSIAREAGHRSKVAVAALQEGVDPVGACVGMRGIRIQNIVKELNDEKIDVIEWSPESEVFIGKALSPARVSDMLLEDDLDTGRTATVLVPDDQLSLAIGREGQNARLAAKLTGWRIDIKSVSEAALEAFIRLDEPPLDGLVNDQPELVAEVGRIIEKKQANRPIPPEEFRTLTDFAKLTEHLQREIREAARTERRAAMDLVADMVPARAFKMNIKELELDDDINRALSRIENVGALMVRMLADENALQRMLDQAGAGDDALEAIRYALDDLVILGREEPEAEEEAPEPEPEVEAVPEAELTAGVEPEAEPVEPAAELAELEVAAEEVKELDEALPAFVEPEPEPESKPEAPPVPAPGQPWVEQAEFGDFDYGDEGDEEDEERKRSRAKKKRRELVFDEDRGRVVAKRRRKRSRQREDWEDFLE
ncbi:MAG: transcription termination/antitermination protein NusA [Anaerolineae bacterium]|nr:transcription termination/antitermination protein NusA [Anaerolineae bacterium]